MIVIPKLSDKEEQILQIIHSNDDYTLQLQAFDKHFPPIVFENTEMGFSGSGRNPELTNLIELLIDQNFIYECKRLSPYLLTPTGRGYLENNSVIVALLDQAFKKLDLPDDKKSEIKSKALNQFKELGQDFVIKLLVESLARFSGLP